MEKEIDAPAWAWASPCSHSKLPQVHVCDLPPSNAWFLGPSRVRIPNGMAIGFGSVVLCTAQSRESLQAYIYGPPSPSKVPHHTSPLPHPGPQHKGHRFSRFCSADDRDRAADRQTTLLDRPHVRSMCCRLANDCIHTASLEFRYHFTLISAIYSRKSYN